MSRWVNRYWLGCAFAAMGTVGCGPSFEDGTGGAGGQGASTSGATMTTTTSTGTSSTGSSSTSTGGSSSTGMPSPNCTVTDGASIGASCGVFVKPGGTGSGTQASPYGTITAALEAASPSNPVPIYVCAGEFHEELAVDAGMTLNGGIDCSGGKWTWVADPGVAQRTIVAPAANELPLRVAEGLGKTRIFGFSFIAADATTIAGRSSIAAIVQSGQIEFDTVHFEAGDAMPGLDATQTGQPGADAPPANNGAVHGAGTCTTPQPNGYPGGAMSTNAMCNAGTSIGGAGGNGGPGTGGQGGTGQDGAINPLGGGKGGTGSALFAMGLKQGCQSGGAGEAGAAGTPGTAGVGDGMLTGTGYVGVDGGAGAAGVNGGGGGGGGGGRTRNSCWGGEGGGSGGAGGCGGVAGSGGTAGGSSIAILSDHALITFIKSSALVGQGGRGGDGAPGTLGGLGAVGGTAYIALGEVPPLYACSGGKGGDGGVGGHGGGGAGGHAVALACTGVCDSTGLAVTPIVMGLAGAGGAGDGTNDGSNGKAAERLEF